MTGQQILKYASIFLFGFVLSLYLFYSINAKYAEKNKTAIENASARANLRITEEISKISLVMESMGFFFEHTSEISPPLFRQSTNPFMSELYGINALGWAPRIVHGSKRAYLRRTESLYEGFDDITAVDSSDKVVISEKDTAYYPITYINPLGPHIRVMGYNMYSDSIRRSVMNTSICSGEIAFSPPVELIPPSGGGKGFLAIKSVTDEVTGKVKGIVLCIYKVDLFISRTLASELKILDISLNDKTHGNKLLYSNIKSSPGLTDGRPQIHSEIKAENRLWEVTFLPKRRYLAYPHAFESYVALFLTLVATSLLLAIIKKRDDYNHTLERKVSNRTAELVASNSLKENLLREIHHRVKNNLQITSSLMNMQKRKLKSREAITALEDSQARISAIALTHQKIYQDKDAKAVNLCAYLTDLMVSRKRLVPSVQHSIRCPDISIDLDRAVPLALIISELVTNAQKHAYQGIAGTHELKIEVRNTEETLIILTVSDNGHGLPDDFDLKKAEGIGFEIVQALCRQISAEFTYFTNNTGTTFQLVFNNMAKARFF